MPSIFFGIHTAKRGILTSQKALDVTSHNIANANTPGYTRQGAVLSTTLPYTLPSLSTGGSGQLGSGVQVSKITRFRDAFLENQIRTELSNLGYFSGQREILESLEVGFLEPSEHGLSNLLNDFWNGWQDLSKNPESLAMRTILAEKATSLTLGFNQVSDHMDQVQTGLVDKINQLEADSERLVQAIYDLQTQIVRVELNGQQPNDLYDRRELMIQELGTLRDITIQNKSNGEIEITFNDSIERDGVTGEITGIQSNNKKGMLGGYGETFNYLEDLTGKINQLATELVSNVNSLGLEFFEPITDPSTASRSIKVSATVVDDPSKITVGSTAEDAEYALKVAQLRHAKTMSGNYTFEGFWQNTIVEVGTKTHEAARREENQQALVNHLVNRREEVSGVSIDEELVNLMKFQYAFQASSRVITVLDDMLDTIINRMGR